MFKPTLRRFGTASVLSIALAFGLFPIAGAHGETPIPIPTESVIVVPGPTLTPTSPPVAFDPNLYSLDAPNSLWVVVNKQLPLNPISYRPKTLTKPEFAKLASNPTGQKLIRVAAKALASMASAMSDDDAGTLVLQSAYRSFSSQRAVHDRQVALLGKTAGEALAARPGYSEHQTGLAADLAAVGQGCLIQTCFSKTVAGKWLAKNAFKYGFILRYPKGKTSLTGYQFEPWHFRYVGLELAKQMHVEKVLVLEQFWKLPPAPRY